MARVGAEVESLRLVRRHEAPGTAPALAVTTASSADPSDSRALSGTALTPPGAGVGHAGPGRHGRDGARPSARRCGRPTRRAGAGLVASGVRRARAHGPEDARGPGGSERHVVVPFMLPRLVGLSDPAAGLRFAVAWRGCGQRDHGACCVPAQVLSRDLPLLAISFLRLPACLPSRGTRRACRGTPAGNRCSSRLVQSVPATAAGSCALQGCPTGRPESRRRRPPAPRAWTACGACRDGSTQGWSRRAMRMACSFGEVGGEASEDWAWVGWVGHALATDARRRGPLPERGGRCVSVTSA